MSARWCAMTLFAAGAASAAPTPSVEGTWHVGSAQVAPWVDEDAERPDSTWLLGKNITFAAGHVEGPGVLSCANAGYEYDQRPLEGLFQGNLPAPVENGAGSVGLVRAPVDSVTLTCDTGVFDMHFATQDALLLGLDNVVWVLDRSPGALAKPGTPEHAVQMLLEDHYANGLGFYQERAAAQKRFFTAALGKRVDDYFAQDFPDDEVPPINGDVITDSQEYPPVFSVREAKATGDAMLVPVRYDDGHATRVVHFRLKREGEDWRVDDIEYEHGTPFTALLALKPGE